MTIIAPVEAPRWGHDLAQSAQEEVDRAMWPYIQMKPLLVADLTAALAAKYPWRKAIVSDGAGNKYEAISNGTAFYYLEGTAV